MDDLGKTLMLLFAMVLIASIVRMAFNEDRMKKAEIDFTSSEFKEDFLEECMEGEEMWESKEYCECTYNYLADNYDEKEWTQMYDEVQEGGFPTPMQDAIEVCADEIYFKYKK